MATPEQIAELRLLIAEPDDAPPYTDAFLGALIDANGGEQNKSAFTVWTQKAASAAELVDISEGGSSRKMGDVYEQALSMAKFFGDQTPGGVTPEAPAYTRIKKLSRP